MFFGSSVSSSSWSSFFVTTTLHVAVAPPLSSAVAVIIAVPTSPVVTTPSSSTSATFSSLVDQLMSLFFALDGRIFVTFISISSSLNSSTVITFLSSLILLTRISLVTFTVMLAFFFVFSLENTVIFEVPTFFPFISPWEFTSATFRLEEVYFTFLYFALLGFTLTSDFSRKVLPFCNLNFLSTLVILIEETFVAIFFFLASIP